MVGSDCELGLWDLVLWGVVCAWANHGLGLLGVAWTLVLWGWCDILFDDFGLCLWFVVWFGLVWGCICLGLVGTGWVGTGLVCGVVWIVVCGYCAGFGSWMGSVCFDLVWI